MKPNLIYVSHKSYPSNLIMTGELQLCNPSFKSQPSKSCFSLCFSHYEEPTCSGAKVKKIISVYKSGIFEGNVFLQEDYDIESEDSSIDLSAIYKSKFKNLKDYEFTVAGLAYAPFLMKNQDEKFSEYEILQLNALAEHLNFKPKIIETPDGQ